MTRDNGQLATANKGKKCKYKHRTFNAAAYPFFFFFFFLVLFYCKIYYYLTIYHIETAPAPPPPPADNQQVLYPQGCGYQEAHLPHSPSYLCQTTTVDQYYIH